MKKKAIVTGAGGFIGYHLTNFLKAKGYYVIGIDIKYPQFSSTQADEFRISNLRDTSQVKQAFQSPDVSELYLLAADMGGMGYIDTVHAKIMHDNSLINANCLEQAKEQGIGKVFFASSACVYPESKQLNTKNPGLKEEDALPAWPDTAYGWEKLYSEQMCLAYAKDYGLSVRIARFHNIYGPNGVFDGGREKAPSALCRKIAQAPDGGTISVWGDGKQTRSYCYIDDCCEGIYRLMQSDWQQPINIGSTELVSVDKLIEIISTIAGKKINKQYDTTKPQGVRGRNSDNTLIKKVLKWEPSTRLETGLKQTYEWINDKIGV